MIERLVFLSSKDKRLTRHCSKTSNQLSLVQMWMVVGLALVVLALVIWVLATATNTLLHAKVCRWILEGEYTWHEQRYDNKR
jgi:hypothetical protein